MHNAEQNQKMLRHLKSEEVDAYRFVNNMYASEATGPYPATGKVIHAWGQFVFELPRKFHPPKGKGHQYICCKTKEEAEKIVQQLRKVIFKKWPDVAEWAGKGWYRWMIYDGRQYTLEFRNTKKKK